MRLVSGADRIVASHIADYMAGERYNAVISFYKRDQEN